MNDSILKFLGQLVVLGVTIVLALLFGLFGTFVCMHLWNWFVVPTLGFHEIDFILMWGLLLTIQALKGYHPLKKDADTEDLEIGESILLIFKNSFAVGIAYGIAFGVGAILHHFV